MFRCYLKIQKIQTNLMFQCYLMNLKNLMNLQHPFDPKTQSYLMFLKFLLIQKNR